MKDHELFLNISDVMLILVVLKHMRNLALEDNRIIFDQLFEKIMVQSRYWGKPSEEDAEFMAGVRQIWEKPEGEA